MAPKKEMSLVSAGATVAVLTSVIPQAEFFLDMEQPQKNLSRVDKTAPSLPRFGPAASRCQRHPI
ncbi:MAG: hypothetical protein ACI802_001289 [Candidatus Paceibacteria bacterium]|jgi:hypothetical protein